MKKNQKGSALVWSLVVVGVLTVLIAGSLTIAYSYYHRAIQINSKRQAYLTAKGVIENVAENIVDGNKEYLALFTDINQLEYKPLAEEGETISLNITLPPGGNVGAIESSSIRINKIDKTMKGYITIDIIASYADQLYEVKADLKLGNIDDVDTWQLVRYYQNGDAQVVSNNITKAEILYTDIVAVMAGKADNTFLDVIKSQTGWDIYLKSPYYREIPKYLNNTVVRFFYCFRNESGTFPKFDKTEMTKTTIIDPYTNKTVNTADVLKGNYYIQPFMCNTSYNTGIIYASTDATPTPLTLNGGGNFGTKINLFYDRGHWYYVGTIDYALINTALAGTTKIDQVVMTLFDDNGSADGNKAADRWERFRAQYLKPENMVQ